MKSRLSSIAALILLALVVSPGLAGGASTLPALPPLQGSDGVLVVRVYYNSVEDSKLLAGFDLFEYNNLEERYFLVAVDRAGLKSLEGLGFRVAPDPEETANFARLSVPLAEQPDTIPGYACYRTVEETFAAAQAMVANHPTLASWVDVGDSWEKVTAGGQPGYDMMVLRLTNSAVAGPKPKFFITAAIHAREYTTAELAIRFAEHLVDNYGIDADATWLLDHHEIHLMLYTNPDGRKQAETGLSWRKNTNNNYCANTNSRGVDLNRNFDFQWGCCGGSSGAQCDLDYRGPSAGSDPETQAVQNYLRAIFPDQRPDDLTTPAPADATGIYLDLHSYAELVMWPWGFTASLAPNSTALQTLGRKLAYYNNYTPEQAIGLYPTDGTTDDYGYGRLGVASYTFELGTAFFQDCATFENTIVPNNLPALIYAAKTVRTPYQTPAGPDALTVAVAPATVAIGDPALLTATINDTRYRSGTGEPTQNIAAAEYYVDTPPWQAGAVAHAMAAADGSFNSTIENVTATIDTAGLAPGRHLVFVRGKDANNNWGAFSAAFLETRIFTVAPASAAVCAPADAVYTVNVGYAASITLSAAGVPAGATVGFSPNPVPGPGTSTLTIGNTGAVSAGSYTFSVTGTGGPYNQTETMQLRVSTAAPAAPSLAGPADGSTGVAATSAMSWNAVDGATSYDIQVSSDPAFTNIVATATGLTDPTFTPAAPLAPDTVYYWHVRATNACGAAWSSIAAFRTSASVCVTYNSTDVPKAIPDNTTVYSTLSVPATFALSDVNVTIGQLTHTYDGDLDLYIIHPDTTQVELSTGNGGSGDNYINTVFDDEAATAITSGSAPFTGSFRPEGLLSALDGKTAAGTWKLRVTDHAASDTGTLSAWSLTACGDVPPVVADYSDLASSYGVAWHTGGEALKLGSARTDDIGFAEGHDDAVGGDGSDDGVAPALNAWWGGGRGAFDVTSSGSGCVNGWMDFGDGTGVGPAHADGDFGDNSGGISEQVIASRPVNAGLNNLSFTVPAGILGGGSNTYAFRFRLTARKVGAPCSPVSAFGAAGSGEVEDYRITFGPLAVTLAEFTAEASAEGVTLRWETVSETDNAGFNVYRGQDLTGLAGSCQGCDWVRLNAALIPAAAPGASQGSAYTWADATAAPGASYWYLLEDVGLDGTVTRHAPVAVTMSEPNALGLAGFGAVATGPTLAGLVSLALIAFAGAALRRQG